MIMSGLNNKSTNLLENRKTKRDMCLPSIYVLDYLTKQLDLMISFDFQHFFFDLQMNGTITIKPSRKREKKLDALFPDGKVISFGAKGYSDYTIHKDPDRRDRYLARHSKDPRSIRTAGGLARDILWSKPNL